MVVVVDVEVVEEVVVDDPVVPVVPVPPVTPLTPEVPVAPVAPVDRVAGPRVDGRVPGI